MIALVDVCSGNLRSVERALVHVGGDVVRTRDPDVIRRADQIVVPGQGAFGVFMRQLAERGLEAPLRDALARGTPYLGICLGLQVLFEVSEEGNARGLGRLAGTVVRFRPTEPAMKIPHMGWNQVTGSEPISGSHVYFVHSFYVVPHDPSIVVLKASYGVGFCAAIRTGNLFATQFHPEKSGPVGLALLRAFVAAPEGT